mmetsp:Transcript_49871/g.74401  ORF Transcript_49871/g.74401 Transcript_49871/m.74401 type:complete len:293 (-) Transcript_49871:604-1482(-)
MSHCGSNSSNWFWCIWLRHCKLSANHLKAKASRQTAFAHVIRNLCLMLHYHSSWRCQYLLFCFLSCGLARMCCPVSATENVGSGWLHCCRRCRYVHNGSRCKRSWRRRDLHDWSWSSSNISARMTLHLNQRRRWRSNYASMIWCLDSRSGRCCDHRLNCNGDSLLCGYYSSWNQRRRDGSSCRRHLSDRNRARGHDSRCWRRSHSHWSSYLCRSRRNTIIIRLLLLLSQCHRCCGSAVVGHGACICIKWILKFVDKIVCKDFIQINVVAHLRTLRNRCEQGLLYIVSCHSGQ